MLVMGLAASLTFYASERRLRLYTESELLENARAADMYLREFLRSAQQIELAATASGSLRSLTTVIDGHKFIFKYDSTLGPSSPRYQRLDFNDYNEVAAHLEDITASVSGGLLIITITTADRLSAADVPRAEPISFTIAADVSRKDFKLK
ncbi:MAG: hypothetical protein LBS62_06700, partial [Clostridiales bacterium]|jgi:hypothetical protein|nr:hypothetical protein [Clostridiales bacterium]